MNFQQLRFIREAARRDFNLTEVGNALYISQSGVSKCIRELEMELGVEIFVRYGRRITGWTPAGEALAIIAERILSEAEAFRQCAFAYRKDRKATAPAPSHKPASLDAVS